MKQLIATDFDGTFIKHGVIDPEDRAVIAQWRRSGRYFGFVTGRGLDFLQTIRDLDVEADYLLIYNGAMLALPDGTVLKEYRIPRPDFERLADFFRAIPDACAHDEPADGQEIFHQYYARFETPERALEAAEEANRRFGDRVTAFVNGEHVNIGKKGSSKAQGVFDALAYYNLPRDAAAVFGDDYNDIEMITVHKGWAVASARPEVLAAAPHICKRIGDTARALME